MISVQSPLVVGSQSPRRSQILRDLGLPIVVCPADIDESVSPGETPRAYVQRVTAEKLRAVTERLTREQRPASFGALVTADTTVVVDDDVLGKPRDVAEAAQLLGRIVGRTHSVLTSYALGLPSAPAEVALTRTVEAQVTMRKASREEILRYAASGEGLDKAGAYAVQGLGAFLVERIDGSYSAVMGLPACELIVDLNRLGLLGPFPFDGPPS